MSHWPPYTAAGRELLRTFDGTDLDRWVIAIEAEAAAGPRERGEPINAEAFHKWQAERAAAGPRDEGLREALERLLRQPSRGGDGWGFNADMHEEEVVTAILADPTVRAALAKASE